VDEALKRAYASRSDYQAAMTDVRCRGILAQGCGSRLSASLSFNADYGAAGHGIQHGDTLVRRPRLCRFRSFREVASTAMFYRPMRNLRMSRERLDNLRAQIDADVRPGC